MKSLIGRSFIDRMNKINTIIGVVAANILMVKCTGGLSGIAGQSLSRLNCEGNNGISNP